MNLYVKYSYVSRDGSHIFFSFLLRIICRNSTDLLFYQPIVVGSVIVLLFFFSFLGLFLYLNVILSEHVVFFPQPVLVCITSTCITLLEEIWLGRKNSCQIKLFLASAKLNSSQKYVQDVRIIMYD